MARQLTPQQQLFLDVLFDGADGDFATAKIMAGYSENTSTTSIVNSLKDEILEATRNSLVSSAPKAAVALRDALIDPTTLGLRDKMIAARDILDRSGIFKSEKVEVGGASAIFILPPKNVVEDEE